MKEKAALAPASMSPTVLVGIYLISNRAPPSSERTYSATPVADPPRAFIAAELASVPAVTAVIVIKRPVYVLPFHTGRDRWNSHEPRSTKQTPGVSSSA